MAKKKEEAPAVKQEPVEVPLEVVLEHIVTAMHQQAELMKQILARLPDPGAKIDLR